MKERFQENKLKGFRKVAGTAVLAVSLAACGSNATETPRPTILPTESPIPTMTAVPSESPFVSPTPTQTPEVTPSPTPEITPVPMLSAKEVMDTLLSQPDKDVKSRSIDTIKEAMTNLWEKHQNSLLKLGNTGKYVPFEDPNEKDPARVGKPSLTYMLEIANLMEKGEGGISGGKIVEERRVVSAGTTTGFIVLYRSTNDLSLKTDLIPLIDMSYDYGSLVYGKGSLDSIRGRMNQDILALFSWY